MNGQDDELWREVLREVTPLNHKPVIDKAAAPPKRIHVRAPTARPIMAHHFDEPAELEAFDTNTLRRIKTGRLSIQATLDLHGMNAEHAYDALYQFISEHYAYGHALVLVITGKGRLSEHGVLRQKLPYWCEDAAFRPMIVGVHKAAPRHGGEGASYVRLRRKR